jgi:hypothetical protein
MDSYRVTARGLFFANRSYGQGDTLQLPSDLAVIFEAAGAIERAALTADLILEHTSDTPRPSAPLRHHVLKHRKPS